MAYRTSLNKKYYNSEDFTAVDFEDEYFLFENTQQGHSKDIHWTY